MGKTTGFLDYTRTESPSRPPRERVRDWEEFHLPLPELERVQQGGTVHELWRAFLPEWISLRGEDPRLSPP